MIVRSTGNLYSNLYLITFGNSCHYILTSEKDTILFDPGTSAHVAKLGARLRQIEIDPQNITKILITQTEAHRIGGLPYLRQHLPNARLAATPATKKLLSDRDFTDWIYDNDIKLSKEFFASGDSLPTGKGGYSAGMNVDIDILPTEILPVDEETSIQIIESTGHTQSSTSYYIDSIKTLICDDAVGYFKGKDLPAPACDFSIEKNQEFLKVIGDLDIASLCLTLFGTLTGDLAKKHIEQAQKALKEITEECEKAFDLGVKNESIKTAIKESFYTIEHWDPISKDCFERSLDKLWEQIS